MALTPSDRVVLIKEIADRLASEDYNLIDLILRQFGLRISETWDGSKNAYVIAMLQEAPDEALIGMGEHVGFHLGGTRTQSRVEPPFWKTGMLKVFVSHLAADRVLAGALQKSLLEHGVCCFVAHNDIQPTAEWLAEIEIALATCDTLIALLTPDFHKSSWTDQEVGFAMGRGLPAFAIELGQVPYGFIGRFQAFNGKGKSAVQLAEEVFDAYCKNKQTQRRMSEVLVGLFEASASFAEAKRLIRYLEELEVWEPTFAERIRVAAKENGQVGHSFGVPRRVAALARKWSD